MSFSVEELSKLEALLAALQLPPDEASELQAGALNRLMDVYHSLTLQAAGRGGQVRVLGDREKGGQVCTCRGSGSGHSVYFLSKLVLACPHGMDAWHCRGVGLAGCLFCSLPHAVPVVLPRVSVLQGRLVPVSLVDQLRGAANDAAADGRPFCAEDWGRVLAVRALGKGGLQGSKQCTPLGHVCCDTRFDASPWLAVLLFVNHAVPWPAMPVFALPCCVMLCHAVLCRTSTPSQFPAASSPCPQCQTCLTSSGPAAKAASSCTTTSCSCSSSRVCWSAGVKAACSPSPGQLVPAVGPACLIAR